MATPLLVVGALLLISLNALNNVDIGFDGRTVLTGSIRLPAASYREDARAQSTWTKSGGASPRCPRWRASHLRMAWRPTR